MKLTLNVWRQKDAASKGRFVKYVLDGVSPDMSFLEMLDMLNESIEVKDEEAIAFESDCREGICGVCSLVINGRAHGPESKTTTCQLHMRSFEDGDTIYIEPWRAEAFPVIKDLVVDRSALDRIMQAGGYISVRTGSVCDAHATLVPKVDAELSMDAASCIGCGACVAACPNGSAMLVTAAKVSHLGLLPQGQPERYQRVDDMIRQMDQEGFGACTNYGECQDACPKGISISFIGRMNRDFIKASFCKVKKPRDEVRPQ
ncbi:succinate dehydrogenase/fumarate reductase iron-sulfur subunit [Oligoflexia bacterium]|nr:succinate dehydrogenase/fumarate reductase iron-sulfur subunit [Oligoflexia bacterium]